MTKIAPFDASAEAKVFGRYLINQKPGAAAVNLYAANIKASGTTYTKKEKKLLRLCLNHPWLTGLVDGGLAIVNPTSALRRRIYIMLAILESSPDYANYFLPRRRSMLYILVVLFAGARAVVKAILGTILVKVVR